MAILEVINIIEMLGMNLLNVLIQLIYLGFVDRIAFKQAFIHAIFHANFLFL